MVELIVSHDSQCHKSSSFKLTTSALLLHKTLVYDYLSIPYEPHERRFFK